MRMQLIARKFSRSMRPAVLAVALVFLAGASAAHAAKELAISQSPATILSELGKIHAEAVAGKRGWDNISKEKRDEVTTQRDRVVALLDGKKSAKDLQPEERTELATVLERINTLAKEAEDERMVCTRERKVGSNFPVNTCMTVAERRRQREQSQQSMVNQNVR
jgi:hypothetical protein